MWSFEWVLLFFLGGLLTLVKQHVESVLLQLLGHAVEIRDPSLISSVGHVMQMHGRIASWLLNNRRTPGYATHILWFDRTLHFIQLDLFQDKTTCHIFALGKYPHALIQAAQTQLSKAALMDYVCVRNGFKSMRLPIPPVYFPWQSQCAQNIIDKWMHPQKDSLTACTSILIAGSPGTGKSVMARIVYQMVNAQSGSTAMVYNIQFQRAEAAYLDSIRPDVSQPLILLADEIDVVMKRCSESVPPHFQVHAVGDGPLLDKRDLCELLDTLNSLPNSILIATTNESMDHLEEVYPHFVRTGRFNLKTTFSSSATVHPPVTSTEISQ